MHVISGRKCSERYQKSGPLGSLVRTLLESPQWWKEGFSLKWDVKRLCSERTIIFTDTNCDSPSPSNASAKTSKPSDTKSSRFLFRLRLVGLPIDETECFSSPIMLKTPTAFDGKTALPTSAGKTSSTGTLAQEIANGYAQKRGLMLPTPETQGLASMGLLPTPSARDYQPPYNPDAMVRKNGMMRDDQLSALSTMLGLKERGGITFRLSPLFTQEMMGFPRLWTELPWASTSGETNPSKPTETP